MAHSTKSIGVVHRRASTVIVACLLAKKTTAALQLIKGRLLTAKTATRTMWVRRE